MVGLRKAVLAMAIGLALVGLWCPEARPDGVLILKSRDIGPFQEAAAGLASVLDSAGVRVVIHMHSPGESGDAPTLAEVIAAEDVDLLVTVGTVATDRVLELASNIPTVFCMVLDPVGRGFVRDLGKPGGRVTGVEMDIPIEAQLEALKQTVPKARRIGVLYSTERNRQLVDQATGIADSMGLKLIPAEVMSDEALPRVLRKLTGEIDALWGVPDPVAFSNVSTKHIILTTLRGRIPFMGLSASFVKAGALLALSCDYYDVGCQAAETALEVLHGHSPGEIPVCRPRATALHLSLKTARLIGIDIPPSVLTEAKEIRQ
jgi:putative ABC transport system substrate-binding protein